MPLLVKPGVSRALLAVHPVPLGLTYVDPDGQEWDLTDRDNGVVATACAGISGPPVAATRLPLPGGGSLPQSYQAASRNITLGVHVSMPTQDDYLTLCDQWARAIWNERLGEPAPGLFVLSRPDGSARQIEVNCVDGADQTDADATKSGLTWSTYTLTFTADDPMWSDADPIVLTFGTNSAPGVPAMPPIRLAPATLLGANTVVNSGDADSYPVWTIYGPGQPTITNNTTGRSFGLGVTLASGEVITVDTRPTLQSAVDGLGNDRWTDLLKSSPRDLWALVPGTNDINLSLSGSGTGSQIVLTYTRRWLRS